MKKLITLNLLAASTAFGQGYFSWISYPHHIADGFTVPGTFMPTNTGTMNAALLLAPANTTPDVDSIATFTPTNGGSLIYDGFSNAHAWSDILDGQFTVAENASGDSMLLTPA